MGNRRMQRWLLNRQFVQLCTICLVLFVVQGCGGGREASAPPSYGPYLVSEHWSDTQSLKYGADWPFPRTCTTREGEVYVALQEDMSSSPMVSIYRRASDDSWTPIVESKFPGPYPPIQFNLLDLSEDSEGHLFIVYVREISYSSPSQVIIGTSIVKDGGLQDEQILDESLGTAEGQEPMELVEPPSTCKGRGDFRLALFYKVQSASPAPTDPPQFRTLVRQASGEWGQPATYTFGSSDGEFPRNPLGDEDINNPDQYFSMSFIGGNRLVVAWVDETTSTTGCHAAILDPAELTPTITFLGHGADVETCPDEAGNCMVAFQDGGLCAREVQSDGTWGPRMDLRPAIQLGSLQYPSMIYLGGGKYCLAWDNIYFRSPPGGGTVVSEFHGQCALYDGTGWRVLPETADSLGSWPDRLRLIQKEDGTILVTYGNYPTNNDFYHVFLAEVDSQLGIVDSTECPSGLRPGTWSPIRTWAPRFFRGPGKQILQIWGQQDISGDYAYLKVRSWYPDALVSQ